MQAVRVERSRSLQPRWLQHLALLAAVGSLFSWVVAVRSPASQLVDGVPLGILAPPGSPSQEWRPIRVPVRTATGRETWPGEVAVVPPSVDAATREAAQGLGDAGQRVSQAAQVVSQAAQGVQWVQAHRRTTLLTAPEPNAAPTFEIPQWSHLKVLETRANGWLRVSHGDDGERTGQAAWIYVSEIGASGGPTRFVTSTRELALWTGESPDADQLATVPRFATLELAGPERSGRVAVRVADAGGMLSETGQIEHAWVDRDAVAVSAPPSSRDLPLGRPFSPFAGAVRLAVPYRTQLDGSLSAASNCGPTSIAMAMEAFGISLSTAQARSLATRYMGIYSPWTGTTLEALRHVAQSHGLEGLDLYEGGRYKRWSLEDVRRHLRAGHPVIPQLRYRLMPGREWFGVTFDHYVVLTGLDGDDFVYNDPATIGGRGQNVMTAKQLQRAWMGSDHPGAAVAIARPL